MLQKRSAVTLIAIFSILLTGWKSIPGAWSDPQTGIAIGGYDPLAYLTHPEPKKGYDDLEHYWQGVTWQFANEGNKLEFARNPELYAPQFSGYDIVALSKGLYVRGSPVVFERYKEKLFLFESEASKKEWQKQRIPLLRKISAAWPKLSVNIGDYYAPPPIKDLYPRK